MFTLAPHNNVVSSLIGDYASGEPVVIYGNAASGKTTTCLLATIEAAKKGHKIVYVDTEGGFNTSRLAQLGGGNVFDYLDSIFLFSPKSFHEQHEVILKLQDICKSPSVKLVIIDTIGNHYRVSLNDDAKLTNSMMAVELHNLLKIARDLDKVVIITNQVRADMEKKKDISIIGGKFFDKANCVIELNKVDSNRHATLIRHKVADADTKNIGKRLEFEIKEAGLFVKG
jgi:DNA repair protein RadB